jgi:thermitase
MNKTSYSKRGPIAFSALLIVAIILSLVLTNLFSPKAEETADLDQTKGTAQVSDPASSSTTNNNDDSIADNNNDVVVEDVVEDVVDVAQPQNDPVSSEPVPGQVVVQFLPESSELERAAYVESFGGTVVNTIEALDTVVLNVPEEIALEPLPASPIVQQAEQDHFISALDNVNPNDPNYASQWALSAINAPAIWAQIPEDTPTVTVAVVDTGICPAHEDLAGRIVAGWDFIEKDAVPQDANGHGCFVSGLIAANMNNGVGIAGVAPNANIMPLRVLDANGNGSDSNVAAAIVYAANHGAQVINLSLGGSYPSLAMENAVNYAVAKGVSVVAAAGNSGTLGALYPAKYPAAIAVGSLDSNLQHSSFSNYGSDIDIWAPGGNIMSTKLSGGYGTGSGTSFAAPYVAGAKAIDLALNRATPLTGGNLDFSIATTPSSDPANDTDVSIAAAPTNDNFASATNINVVSPTLPYTPIIITTDATTEAGDPVPTTCGTGTIYDDMNALWTYTGSWGVSPPAGIEGPYAKTQHTTISPTATAAFSFTGPASFSLFYTTGSEYGQFDVYVNGTFVWHNPGGAAAWQNIYTSPNYSGTGTYTVMIKNIVGYVDVDAIRINNTGSGLHSVWYKYETGDYAGRLHVDTQGSNYDTGVALWTKPAGSLIEFACNNNEPSQPGTSTITSYLELDVAAHTTYYIEVMSFGAPPVGGWLHLNFDFASEYYGPSNDDFSTPTEIINDNLDPNSAFSYILPQEERDTRLATQAPDDPFSCGANSLSGDLEWTTKQGGASVWYKYTVPAETDPLKVPAIQIDTKGSTYDTVLSVWGAPSGSPGSRVFTYQPVATSCNDDIGDEAGGFSTNSKLKFEVTPGETYYILAASRNVAATGTLAGASAGDISAQFDGGTLVMHLYSPAPLGAGTYEDDHTGWSFTGDWYTYSGTGPSDGTERYSTDADASAKFYFEGVGFVLKYAKNYNRGNIEVWVDGVKEGTINANSPTLSWQNTYTSQIYPATAHTVEFKHGGPSGTYIDIDSIQIIDIVPQSASTYPYDDTDTAWTYGGSWNLATGSGPYYSTRHYTTTPNNIAMFSFVGPAKFILTYTKLSTGGSFQVYVDDVYVTTISAYSATTLWKQTYTSPPYSSGLHRVVIKHASTSGKYIDVDAIQILGLPSLGTTIYDDRSALWAYTGTWKSYSGSGPLYNTRRYTATLNATASFSFIGPARFTLYYTKMATCGSFKVYVDGVYLTTINAYSAKTRWRQSYTSGPYLSGMHTVMIKNISSGKTVDVDAIKLIEALDTIAPSAITDLVAASGATPGTVDLTWTAPGNDSTSGTAASYLVRYSTAPIYASNWASATPASDTIPTPSEYNTFNEHMTVTGLMPGLTYYFAVRALDAGPNLGSMSFNSIDPALLSATATALPSAPAGSATYDDRDVNWYYAGTWTAKYPVTGPLNSSRHYTTTLNKVAAFTFTGPAKFILYYAKTATSGNFQVYVDNALVTTVSAYSATTLWRQTYTSPLYSSGTHTVVLKNTTSGKTMDVDAIQIVTPPVASATASVYDDRHALWTYTGTWTSYSGSGPLNNTRRYSATLNGTASFPFTVSGTPARFVLTYTKTSTSGNFEIYVDGVFVTSISAYNSSTKWKQTYTSPFYGDGTHIVTLKNVTSGKYMDVDAITISTTTDVTPPSAITTLSATTGSNTGEVNLDWTAPTDDGTITSYLVRYSTTAIDESNWNSATAVSSGVPPYAAGSATMTVTGLTPGVTYYFAMRSQDTGPNLSDMSNNPSAAAQVLTPVSTAGVYDDTLQTANWYYSSGWTAKTGTGPLNSTRHTTATLNATATFTFNLADPAKFVLTYAKAAANSKFQVYVDGSLLATIDSYSATTLWKQTYTSPNYYASGTHTVVIKNIVSGKYTDLDAIELRELPNPEDTIYDDDDISWTYTGTWGTYSGGGPYADTLHISSTVDEMAEFTFTGPASFTLIYSKASDYGSFQVSVDGALVTTIDAYNAAPLWQQTYTSSIYLSGSHTVNVKNIGSKMDVDAIQIIPLYDDPNTLWAYTGTWTSYSGTGPLNNTRRYTSTLNGTAAFSFTGPARFAFYYTKTSTSGNFDVYVDGVYIITLNAYNATTKWKQAYTSPLYLSGTHTVVFKNVTSGKTMDVDAIQITSPVATDTIAPSAITNLAAISGASTGTVNLSWTAPGDDDGTPPTGTATSYLVRYSTASINASNWASATPVSDAIPTPSAYNTLGEHMTVTGLIPGTTYYFAVRALDEATNLGDISSNTDPTKLYAVAKIPAAVVGAGPHDDTAWYYNSATAWTASTGVTGPYSGTQHITTTPNSVAAVSFTGPANFILSYTKLVTGGSFAIYVDNVLATTISTYNTTTLWQQTYISRLYPSSIHTVVIKNTGASGKVMDVDAIQIVTVADTTPPSTITDLAAASGTETGSVNLTWTAPGNNGTTGTALSYLVRYSTIPITAGNWASATAVTTGVPAPQEYGETESMTVTGLTPGTTYYFAVRAQDAVPYLGGISNSPSAIATAPAPVTSAGTYDDIDDAWDYIGTWTTFNTSGPYLSTLHYTSTPNNMAAFSFTGPAKFILSYTRMANRGSFQVYVDNALLTTINAYSATTLWQQTYASPFYSTSTHTVVIKNVSASGKVVDMDAIQIVAPPSSGTYDDNSALWTYASTWKTYSGSGPLYSTRHYTATLNATASFSFTGPARFTLYYTKMATSGKFRVYVDGALVTTINAYNATTRWKQKYTSPYYATGTHTVLVKNITSGKYTDVDAINIAAAPDTTLPSAITDLAAVSGGSTGTVNLSWTTPGDDDGTPPTSTATSYLVRNSIAPIDASNWASATAVTSGIPTPKAPGTAESMTVTGLIPGTTYYFAVRAQDETPNLGGMSSGIQLSAEAKDFTTSVGAGIYDDTLQAASWYYGGNWASYDGAGPLNNTIHYTSTLNNIAAFSFTSPAKFILTYSKSSNRGSFEVYVDGTLLTTINAYSAATLWKQTYSSPFYSAGTHLVVIKNIGPSGKYMDVDAIQIIAPLDPTPPSAIAGLTAEPGTAIGSINLEWTAPGDDGTTGKATSYWVRYSTSEILTETDWASATAITTGIPTPQVYGTSESLTVTGLTPGATYYFAVRAQDEEPNLGNISNSPSAIAAAPAPVGANIYDDRDASWNYIGTWANYSGTGPYASTLRTTTAPNNLAAFSFTGPAQFTLTYSKGSTRTSFQVYVDGNLVTTLNAYSATTLWKQTYTSPFYLPGTHTVVVKHAGTSGKIVDVDAIQVIEPPSPGTTIYDDRSTLWSYTSSWSATTLTGPYASTRRYTTTPNSTASFSFTGPARFTLYYAKMATSGSFEVYVDDVLETTISTYNATTLWQRTYTSQVYLSGAHTVVVKNISPSGSTVDVDAIQIISPEDATDTIAPSAIEDLGAASGAAIGTVDLSWTAPGDDGTSGTADAYQIRYSTTLIDAGNWASATEFTPTPALSGTAESVTVTGLIPGTTYYFAVRAEDEANNLGGISNSPSIEAKNFTTSVGAGTYDNADAAWYYGNTWALSGALHTTSTLNDIAAFSFTGPAKFILSYSKGPTHGSFEVYVDGTLVTTINAYSATTLNGQYTGPCKCDTDTHLLVIKNIGPSAGVDSIQLVEPPSHGITPTYYDDADPLWTYTGTWTAATGVTGAPYANTRHYTATPDSTAEFSFTGPAQFILTYTASSTSGSFQVYVDDVLVGTINAYSAATAWQQTWQQTSIDGTPGGDPGSIPVSYSAGPHMVTIKHDGPNNNASGTYIDVDAIQILP